MIAAVSNGFERRFGPVMDLYNRDGLSVPLYIAMATNPKYKLNFLGMREIPTHTWRQIRKILVAAGVDEMEKQQQRQRQEHNHQLNADEPHTSVEYTAQTESGANNHEYNDLLIENDVSFGGEDFDFEMRVGDEIDRFLRSKTTVNIEEGLENFPIIARLYMKYNSIRSTEAICERMFSYAGE